MVSRIFLIFILFQPIDLYSMGLEKLWDYLDETEENLYSPNNSNKNQILSKFWKSVNKPKTFHRETTAYRLHSFCHKYYKLILKEDPSYYRPQIESLIWEFYLPQVRNLQYNQPKFQCQSTPLDSKLKTIVEFRLDIKNGFYPMEWKLVNENNVIEVRSATNNKKGIIDKKFIYQLQPKNCPQYGEEDTNSSGKSDRFYYYNNCNLVKIEEDYNHDGIKDRICILTDEDKSLQCTGVGEDSLKLAQELSKINPIQSIAYFKKSISEYESSFGLNSRHVCNPYLQILKMQYDLFNFDSVALYNSLIEKNPYCSSEKLEAQVYDAFTNLYKLNRYKDAAQKYEIANTMYREEYGWHSIEMNLALAYAYLKYNNTSSCLESLERIEDRRLTEETLYLLYYFKGSCLLEANELKSSYQYLKRAQAYTGNSLEKAQVLLKLGILFSNYPGKEKESSNCFEEATELNPIHKNFVKEFKKYKSLVAE